MKIDLHIHTKTGSDGNLSVEEVFEEARSRAIDLISITDHDSIDCQESAISLAKKHGMSYVTGVELNVTFQYPESKPISLDFLGYKFDPGNSELQRKLQIIRDHREDRARQILQNLNAEFELEGIDLFTDEDLQQIQATVDGAFGRPHIANYLVKKEIVSDKQEAFDKYLVQCDVPKYPLSISEASTIIRNAGGILALAHPNDPNGTSLMKVTTDLHKQSKIIEEYMLEYIDGIECWHSRHDPDATSHYIEFAKKNNLIMTGGSDCHQNPILMGTVQVPEYVSNWFN
ncbi:MAG: PHP domain-containing protein [Chloroflexi bacterium]|jgi:3',5'-nucleoside bisphosphate phosphatase|nr:PHP domain-containing protein [Chloroflexota bacterium]